VHQDRLRIGGEGDQGSKGDRERSEHNPSVLCFFTSYISMR
jgi:hypothetical protein